MSKKNLKRANLPTLVICLVWNTALFIVCLTGTDSFWKQLHDRVTDLKARDSLFLFATPLILSIATGLLPASWKAILVFWRLRHVLPGCRAFSEVMKSDSRIDEKRVRARVDAWPVTPGEENALWYRWYKTVQDRMIVQEAHKHFLLNRDLTGISFLFCLLGTLSLPLAGGSMAGIATHAGVTLFQYIAFALVARNHGNRFVCNVLVEYQSKK